MDKNQMNQKLILTAEADTPTDPAVKPGEDPGVTFTPDQFAILVDVLKLESTATADNVIAAVTALAEQAAKSTDEVEAEIKASTVMPQGVTIDAHVWRDMKRAVERGLTLDKQEYRLAAEQTVDQAIRLGKASPYDREKWVAAYQADPESTVHALNRAQEIPRIEIGYGMDPTINGAGQPAPKGWVR